MSSDIHRFPVIRALLVKSAWNGKGEPPAFRASAVPLAA